MGGVDSHTEVERLRARLAELERERSQLQLLLRSRAAESDSTVVRLRTVLDTVSDAIVVTDGHGRIRLLNSAATELLGLDPLLAGTPLTRDIDPALLRLIQRCRLAAESVVGEIRMTEGRIGQAVVNPIGDVDSTGVVTIVRDVTYERELERMKSEFVASVTYDLRAPLASITGFAQLVGKRTAALLGLIEAPDARTRRHMDQVRGNVEIIVEESRRLTRRIDEIIELAGLEAGRVELARESTCLNDLVEIAIEQSRGLFPDGLTLELAEDMPAVQLDRQRIVQAVGCMLSNAATHGRGRAVRVVTRVSATAVAVSVRDSGPGITAVDPDALFERSDRARGEGPGPGRGFGLPFCRGVIELHGGTIWAESEPGRGATITCRIPRQ